MYDLYEIGEFKYISCFLSFTENEIDHVFILRVNKGYNSHDELFNPNKKETEDLKWFDLFDIQDFMRVLFNNSTENKKHSI